MLLWSVALSLVAAAWLIDEPVAFGFRSLGFALVILAASATVAAAVRTRRWRLAAVLLGAVGLAGWHWAAPRIDEAALWADPAAARRLGSHFVVGYDDVREVRRLSRAGLIGGIFLTRRNVAGRSIAQVAAEVAGLQAERRAAGWLPLVAAVDQEGGPVDHMSPPLDLVPPLAEVAALPASERSEAARRLGLRAGRDLASLGVTLDLAPVVDLRPTGERSLADLHTRIDTRAISANPDVTATVAAGFAEGLLAAGITPTAKHFPDLGSVRTDTHLFGASLDKAQDRLAAEDWPPFRDVLALRGAAVMLSHAAVDALDPGVPASRSRPVVQGLLRDRWGFGGLAITDDLTMGAVVHSGLCRAVEGSLDAGVDLLLVSWDTDRVYPALLCAARAMAQGRLDTAVLAASEARLRGAAAGSGALTPH